MRFHFLKNSFLKIYLITFFFLGIQSAFCQEVNMGADVVSRYIWRGIDFGNAPSVQPNLSFEAAGFEVGAWGAYQVGRDANGQDADEIDLFLGYSHQFGEISLGLIVTDYYFPNSGVKFGNFNNWDNANGKGAHTLEIGASISGGESFPLSFSAFMNVYNDPDNTAYFDLSYSTALNKVGIDFFVSATPGGDNLFYYTKNFNVVNLGITATRNLEISESLSIPVFVSYILNPYVEKAHFVIGFSI